ncbi:uncharacterized protein [Drosophila tropicalis]|uniref:uncharacterized protein n=1 Tax=Drosophila tropicalis TaxID=46794 RepID=UPI0035ABC7FD
MNVLRVKALPSKLDNCLSMKFIIVPDEAVECNALIGFDFVEKFTVTYVYGEYTFSKGDAVGDSDKECIAGSYNVFEVASVYEAPTIYQKAVRELIESIEEHPKQTQMECPVKLQIIPDATTMKFYQSPSRLSACEAEAVKNQVDEWLTQGIVRKSTSSVASRVVVVQKKDVPLIEEVLEKLQAATFFSVLDLENGFFHVPGEESTFKQTTKKEDVPREVTSYVLYLQDFTCDIIHKPGKSMLHVDHLSRYPQSIYNISTEVSARIKKAQSIDNHIKAVITILNQQSYENYKIKGEFVAENKVEHILTTTGVARGNGQIERVNRSILAVISKLSAEESSKWYKYVPQVQKALNSQVHASTKVSSFELMFGTKMCAQADRVLCLINEEFINNFNAERESLRDEAKKNILEAQMTYKRNFDKGRKQDHGYLLGDLVAIKRTQFVAGRKLASCFLGPYEVTRIKRNGRYDVRKAAQVERPNQTSTSSDNMKLWRYVVDNDDPESSGTDDDDQEEPNVKRCCADQNGYTRPW